MPLTIYRHAYRSVSYSAGLFHFAPLTHDLIERDESGAIIRSAYLQPRDSFELADRLDATARCHSTLQEGIAISQMAQMLSRYVAPRGATHADASTDDPTDADATGSDRPTTQAELSRQDSE